MTRILVVEDDRDIAQLVGLYLTRAGFTADLVDTGADALTALGARPPDLVILDVMLPHVSGTEVCRLIRANPKTAGVPVIMLTARTEESDRIAGLELGADDYIAKPFSPGELVARVKALLRRAAREPGSASSSAGGSVTYGPIVVDSVGHEVGLNGVPITLTAKEFLLLSFFLAHRGRVLSRDTLLTDVWGYSYTGGTRTVDVHVRRLREKLPPLSEALVTVKQFGYKLLDDPPSAA